MKGTFKKHLDESMKDPAFKKAWHDLDSEFELLESLLKAREKAGSRRKSLQKNRDKTAGAFEA